MWLPKEERYLLMAYYTCMPELRVEGEDFSVDELKYFVVKTSRIPFIGQRKFIKLAQKLRDKRNDYSQIEEGQQPVDNNYKLYQQARWEIGATNDILKERGFVEVEDFQNGIYKVKLTLEGLDLGRKYSSKLHTFLLLCNEYKVWIIIGLIISFVVY